MNTLTLITPPALEPVSLTEAKAQLRVGESSDDGLITSLIVVARQVAEQLLGRALLTQTLKWQMDATPPRVFRLPRAPVQSVSYIRVYDEADTASTISTSLYQLLPEGRVGLRSSASWPVAGRSLAGFEVQYVAGYGSSVSDVPAPIRQGVLAHAAHLYHHRGDGMGRDGQSDSNALYAVPQQALLLYAPYRLLPGLA